MTIEERPDEGARTRAGHDPCRNEIVTRRIIGSSRSASGAGNSVELERYPFFGFRRRLSRHSDGARVFAAGAGRAVRRDSEVGSPSEGPAAPIGNERAAPVRVEHHSQQSFVANHEDLPLPCRRQKHHTPASPKARSRRNQIRIRQWSAGSRPSTQRPAAACGSSRF